MEVQIVLFLWERYCELSQRLSVQEIELGHLFLVRGSTVTVLPLSLCIMVSRLQDSPGEMHAHDCVCLDEAAVTSTGAVVLRTP